jgi:hypothetical protein
VDRIDERLTADASLEYCVRISAASSSGLSVIVSRNPSVARIRAEIGAVRQPVATAFQISSPSAYDDRARGRSPEADAAPAAQGGQEPQLFAR